MKQLLKWEGPESNLLITLSPEVCPQDPRLNQVPFEKQSFFYAASKNNRLEQFFTAS